MEWLNFHHLYYFWVVAKSGGIARASGQLRLAQSTISNQIRTLEAHFARDLFIRRGGRLELTELGYVVFRYADNIFALGRELQSVVRKDGAGCRPLVIGVADVVPKLAARRFLEPAFRLANPVRLICREDRSERLLSALFDHQLDLVLCDAAPELHPRHASARWHLVGDAEVVLLGSAELAARYREGFPGSLQGAPLLLPTDNTELRRSLDAWLRDHQVQPQVVAELEDSALLTAFGESGVGLFPAPRLVADELVARGSHEVGIVTGLRERYYAVSLVRSEEHPAFAAIAEVIGQDVGTAWQAPAAGRRIA